jgi:hypothetical protein
VAHRLLTARNKTFSPELKIFNAKHNVFNAERTISNAELENFKNKVFEAGSSLPPTP